MTLGEAFGWFIIGFLGAAVCMLLALPPFLMGMFLGLLILHSAIEKGRENKAKDENKDQ